MPRLARPESFAPLPVPAAGAPGEQVFERAAEVFRLMSAPMRLKIISALCQNEKNVGELLLDVPTTQPNMSQHLNALYKAGVVGRRRESKGVTKPIERWHGLTPVPCGRSGFYHRFGYISRDEFLIALSFSSLFQETLQ